MNNTITIYPKQHLSLKDTKLCCKILQVSREVTEELNIKILDTGKPGSSGSQLAEDATHAPVLNSAFAFN